MSITYVGAILTNPKSLTYTLHNRQGQLLGFHLRIFFVNMDKEYFFISGGTNDHIFGPRYASVSVPFETDLTLCVLKSLPPGYLDEGFKGKTKFMIFGESPYHTL